MYGSSWILFKNLYIFGGFHHFSFPKNVADIFKFCHVYFVMAFIPFLELMRKLQISRQIILSVHEKVMHLSNCLIDILGNPFHI